MQWIFYMNNQFQITEFFCFSSAKRFPILCVFLQIDAKYLKNSKRAGLSHVDRLILSNKYLSVIPVFFFLHFRHLGFSISEPADQLASGISMASQRKQDGGYEDSSLGFRGWTLRSRAQNFPYRRDWEPKVSVVRVTGGVLVLKRTFCFV